ncbi:MAG: transcriptional regulator [Lentisphaeria bacterium]
MPVKNTAPYDALEKIFHEPNRLAIMSALCAAPGGLPFNDLKAACKLTDGNLSRHLAVLEEAGAVRVKKSFVGVKPRTTVFITEAGLDRFNDYLAALEEVLEQARRAQAALEAGSKTQTHRLARGMEVAT